MAELHTLYGRHHLRGGLQRQGQDGGGQAGAAENRQVNRALLCANPGVSKQAGLAVGPGFGQAGEGVGTDRPRQECGLGGQVLLCRHGGGAGGGFLQSPGAHRQEETHRQSTSFHQQGETEQESPAVTQPSLLM